MDGALKLVAFGNNFEPNSDVDLGDIGSDASYVFYFTATRKTKFANVVSNERHLPLRLEQWKNSGKFGYTVAGVADYKFASVEGKSIGSIFSEDVHLLSLIHI